ncbi:MAG: polysaccharide biosynthesis protein [Candidatus Cloacimonetes bacterium]|nr:polysaccharide biosynthesis protein [Candidatus Cloacimonadota bacterium]MDY0230482.1 polysaccharide biosynthesis protein [Candidatus Cloacimonadaceae bacterium]
MKNNKTLLITGGTGSFGNAVLRRFLAAETFSEIRIFSRDEKKQDDMRQFYRNDRIKYYIGDVRSDRSIKTAMQGVDYVFHAAALKQVPSCEFFPTEAVRTNVMGLENVIDAALDRGVQKMISLSTDKAVYPINAMGMTKALAEKVMVAKSRQLNGNGTLLCGTRYGNVMASRGSVIPLFVNQIKEKQPLTITDPGMTRFMMTLEDAVELVLFAFENGKPGDIFVQKSPAATIAVLAQALLELYDADNKIRIIGTRHGEKVYESLVSREEMAKAEDLGDYYRIPADTRDLNYSKYFSEGNEKISKAEEYTSHNTQRLDVEGTKELLLKLAFIRQDVLGETQAAVYEP